MFLSAYVYLHANTGRALTSSLIAMNYVWCLFFLALISVTVVSSQYDINKCLCGRRLASALASACEYSEYDIYSERRKRSADGYHGGGLLEDCCVDCHCSMETLFSYC